MGSRGRRHSKGALALGLVLGLSLTSLACGSDDVSTPTGASTTTPGPGPVSTGFETPTALGQADVKGADVTTEAAHDGTRGLEVRATGSDAYARWNAGVLGSGHPYWTFRAWVRVIDWTPGESVDLFTVRNLEVKNNFDLFVGAPYRRLQWDLFRENSGQAPPLSLGVWHFIEARGSFASSTYTADVRIDGVPQKSIASIDQPPSAVSEFILGSIGTAKTNRAQFDDLRVALGNEPLPFLGLPAAPPATPSSEPAATSTPTQSRAQP